MKFITGIIFYISISLDKFYYNRQIDHRLWTEQLGNSDVISAVLAGAISPKYETQL